MPNHPWMRKAQANVARDVVVVAVAVVVAIVPTAQTKRAGQSCRYAVRLWAREYIKESIQFDLGQ